MRTFFFACGATVATGLLLVPACGPSLNLPTLPDIDASGINLEGGAGGEGGDPNAPRGVGQKCDDGGKCRPGLACNAGVCEPGRSLAEGAACVISAECKDGLFCGPGGKCAKAGPGGQGDTCSSDADCKSGFRCGLAGFATECQAEGKGDVGGKCASSKDCFGGLLCAEGVCAPPPPGATVPPLAIPKFKGVVCDTESGPVAAHFRVPRGTGDGDFFRLPFPNDVRRKNGKLDLAGFPTPGADLLGYDLVDRWARFLEETGNGWSVYPTITFRFSGEIDFDSLKAAGAARFVDVTANEGGDLGYSWAASTGRTAYVCPNNVGFRPPDGAPLEGGHTYAVLMTNAVKAKGGGAVQAPADLTALVGAADPGGDLSAAYAAYAPLRTWAASKSFALGTLVNAAVFTVGKHDDIGKKLAPAVAAAPLATASSWVNCAAAPSPCAQATDTRACPATPSALFDELHALVTLPQFQKGNLPFMEPADGGDLVLDAGGQPVPQGTIQVCMALTVPKGTMPAAGWPLVVYAHGTGGSFRSHIEEGVAARLSVDPTKIAVLGIDQVGHGTRRGASTAKPENVFFNFPNPAAARGNVLQGAADQIALARFAKSISLVGAASPTGADVKVDRIAFWGHSQGATHGAIAMPYTQGVAGALLSGNGASLLDSLLTKKSPVNLAALAPLVLSEAPGNIGKTHPALAMFQNAIDPADPLAHAAAIIGTGPVAKHVFMPYGQGDTYSTPSTQLAYLAAAGLGVAQHPASVTTPDDLGKAPQAIPYGGNAAGGLTAVARQYAPSGFDGHFVVFKDADAKVNADRFLVDVFVTGASPKIGR